MKHLAEYKSRGDVTEETTPKCVCAFHRESRYGHRESKLLDRWLLDGMAATK